MLQKITAKHVFGYYWRIIKHKPGLIAGQLILIPIAVLTEVYLSALVLAQVIERLSKGDYQSGMFLYGFGKELILFAILMLIGTISWRVADYFSWKMEGSSLKRIAEQVHSHLLDQSADFHANSFSGGLVSQNNKLMTGYVRIMDTILYQVIPMVVGMTFTIAVLATKSPPFVIGLIVLSSLYIVSGWFATKQTRLMAAEHASQESVQTGYLADTVTNVMAIKSFAASTFEKFGYSKVTSKTERMLYRVMGAQQKQMLFYSLLNRIVASMALVTTVISVVRYNATVATAFLVFTYTSALLNYLWQFCNSALKNFNRSIGDAGEMIRILNLEPSVKDIKEPELSRIKEGRIDFKDVCFTHNGSNTELFSNLNLSVKPGEKIGLVGHSGSGKTTLSRIMLRFSDINSGQILVDGQDISKIRQDDLRSHIAYVPQEPLLFHRSIRDNIAYGKDYATLDEVIQTSKLAHSHEFVKDLPFGYDTEVGERGVKLSGGQRQRVAIARAMLKDAPILLLDEATSALDSESEVLIQKALWKLMEGRTAIVIAHRLSTIQKMDRIIVLDNGKIIEQGSHQELLKKNGKYAELWAHQSGGFIED